jgi:hypothetical protein
VVPRFRACYIDRRSPTKAPKGRKRVRREEIPNAGPACSRQRSTDDHGIRHRHRGQRRERSIRTSTPRSNHPPVWNRHTEELIRRSVDPRGGRLREFARPARRVARREDRLYVGRGELHHVLAREGAARNRCQGEAASLGRDGGLYPERRKSEGVRSDRRRVKRRLLSAGSPRRPGPDASRRGRRPGSLPRTGPEVDTQSPRCSAQMTDRKPRRTPWNPATPVTAEGTGARD